jgi:hypothetical protein
MDRDARHKIHSNVLLTLSSVYLRWIGEFVPHAVSVWRRVSRRAVWLTNCLYFHATALINYEINTTDVIRLYSILISQSCIYFKDACNKPDGWYTDRVAFITMQVQYILSQLIHIVDEKS